MDGLWGVIRHSHIPAYRTSKCQKKAVPRAYGTFTEFPEFLCGQFCRYWDRTSMESSQIQDFISRTMNLSLSRKPSPRRNRPFAAWRHFDFRSDCLASKDSNSSRLSEGKMNAGHFSSTWSVYLSVRCLKIARRDEIMPSLKCGNPKLEE